MYPCNPGNIGDRGDGGGVYVWWRKWGMLKTEEQIFFFCVCVCTRVRVRVYVYICSGTCALSQSVSCSDTEIYLATVGRRQEKQNRGG